MAVEFTPYAGASVAACPSIGRQLAEEVRFVDSRRLWLPSIVGFMIVGGTSGVIKFAPSDDWTWRGTEVQFFVTVGGRDILCRVTLEFIKDRLENVAGANAWFDAAKRHSNKIEDVIGRKLATGALQPDGSLLITNTD